MQIGFYAEAYRAHGQRGGDLFERCVARALADSIDRAFHLTHARAHRGQRICNRQSQIVVAMRAPGDSGGIAQALAHACEHRGIFFGNRVADRIRQIDHGRAGADRGFYRLR